MHIEVNRDLDKFKESVMLGLSARQLIYSVIALALGSGIVLLTYPYVGLTVAAYIAVPVVAPIALTGFYSYHGLTFIEMMKLKIHFSGKQPALLYESTECEDEIAKIRMEEAAATKKNGKKTAADKILERKQKKANKKGGSPQ